MADISKITLPSGSTYNFKDEVARQMASAGVSFSLATDAGSTPKDVTWDDNGTTITGTLVASSSTVGVFYLVPAVDGAGKNIYDEYVTIQDNSTYFWEKIGSTEVDLSGLGDLAYKDSASGNYTPEGTVSQPSFTGTQGNISVSGTPSGSISTGSGTANYTPAGSVAAPTITVTPNTATKYVAASASGGGSVSAGSAASLSATVANETLTLSFTPNTPTAVTLPSFESQTIVSGIASASATAPTFTGTGAELVFTGDSLSSTGTFTPNGTVSQPTFSGTQKSVSVS